MTGKLVLLVLALFCVSFAVAAEENIVVPPFDGWYFFDAWYLALHTSLETNSQTTCDAFICINFDGWYWRFFENPYNWFTAGTVTTDLSESDLSTIYWTTFVDKSSYWTSTTYWDSSNPLNFYSERNDASQLLSMTPGILVALLALFML
jgi:hypothetical protein